MWKNGKNVVFMLKWWILWITLWKEFRKRRKLSTIYPQFVYNLLKKSKLSTKVDGYVY